MDALWKENCKRNECICKTHKPLTPNTSTSLQFDKFLEKSVKYLISNKVTVLQSATVQKNELHNWHFSSY